ncbi:MAG: aldehyde dehydrogenase family protein [Candidatus Marinimicrobia bacterium]|nr:aldehyde dehydrogenase family protein [Candidatus Neomarinimicrobiota bacterium]
MSCNLKENVIEVFNPTNGQHLKEIPITTDSQFKEIIEKSIESKNYWNNSIPGFRKNLIKKFRKAIIQNMDLFIETICSETGKKKFEGMLEVYTSVEHMKHSEKLLSKVFKKKNRSVGTLLTKKAWTELQPLGIAGIISPWNYPLILTLTPVIEALSAGNVVILKPSEQTPLTTELLKSIWDESTEQPDILQIIYGGGKIGSKLVNAPEVDIICFTGSTKIGKMIAIDCAKNLKPVILELGGKDPMIICEDANIDRAVNGAVWGGMSNAGQTCISVERIFVHENIKGEFVKKISEKIKKLSAGNSKNSEVGSISVEAGLEKIKSQIKNEKKASEIIQGGNDKNGFYFPPTVVIDPEFNGELMQDETFGPVVSITSFKTEEEAINLANSTGYGLSASVFSANKSKGKKIASQIRAGSVAINDVMTHYGIADLPFGGVGLSGIGRVHGEEGIKAFCLQKSYMTNRINLGDEMWWYSKSEKFEGIIRKFLKMYFG